MAVCFTVEQCPTGGPPGCVSQVRMDAGEPSGGYILYPTGEAPAQCSGLVMLEPTDYQVLLQQQPGPWWWTLSASQTMELGVFGWSIVFTLWAMWYILKPKWSQIDE